MSPFDTFAVSKEEAQHILSEGLGNKVLVKSLRRMSGGMICSVLEAQLNREPYSIILKVAKGKPPENFEWQFQILRFLLENTKFPVPKPYFFKIAENEDSPSVLAMERLKGNNLSECGLSVLQHEELDRQIALAVAELHSHHRDTFGDVFKNPQEKRWVDIFRVKIESTLPICEQRLDRDTFNQVRQIITGLDRIFSRRTSLACLVHGDIWATNIIVDIRDGKVKLSGFVDPSTIYADPEYELAYLEVFRTVGPEFFRIYREFHNIDSGYELRRNIYHLHTMLVHVQVFGDAPYVRRTQEIARHLTDILKGELE